MIRLGRSAFRLCMRRSGTLSNSGITAGEGLMSGEPEHGSARFSRRSLLRSAVGITGVLAATLNPALAQPKISKVAVNYQDHPDGDKRCDKCI